ncbi:MAG: hypothetical protein SGJ27_09070 [Candidatus Melainabacteria bacterium]|nr:hypothetical protein [Candidatus Melainabacteria bacterium]
MTHFSIVSGLAVVAALVLIWRGVFWYREGQKLQLDGYLPPHPTFFGQGLLRVISKLLARLFVGPVKVINRGNASAFTGRLHILPNHQFPLDFTVVGKSLPYGFRHLGTAGQMKGGLRGTLAAFAGFFAIKTEAGKATEKGGGEKAVNAMGLALARNRRSRVLTFPQGKLVGDNVLRAEEFRTGPVRACHVAIQQHGVKANEIAILPMAIHYMRDPRQRSFMHRLINCLGWRSFRSFKMFGETTRNYGAVVVIGKPIPMSELPADPREAIEKVRVIIDGHLTEAKAWAATQIR